MQYIGEAHINPVALFENLNSTYESTNIIASDILFYGLFVIYCIINEEDSEFALMKHKDS